MERLETKKTFHFQTGILLFFLLILSIIYPSFLSGQSIKQVDPFYQQLYEEGKNFFTAGNYSEAEKNFEIAFFGYLNDPSKLLECYVYLTVSCFENKNYDKSKYYSEEIKRLNLEEFLNSPDFTQNLRERYFESTSQLSQNNLADLGASPETGDSSIEVEIERLKSEIRKDRKDAIPYFRLSEIYIDQNRIGSAKSILQNLIIEDRRNGRVYYELGKIFILENKQNEALEQFQKAIDLLPDDIEILYLTAVLNYEIGNIQQSKLKFQQVQKLDKTFKEIERYLTLLEEMEGDSAVLSERYLDLARSTQDFEKKLAFYMLALEANLTNLGIYFELANVYKDAKKYKKAEGILETLKSHLPKNARVYKELGSIYLLKKSFTRAITNFEEARELGNSEIEMRYDLGKAYMEKNRFPEASEEFKSILEGSPSYKDTAKLLQFCLERIR